jgi:CheY-like chemotaxis protein
MIRRVGEPEPVISPTGRMWTWRVTLADSPSRQWRHSFLERACALGLFFDSRVRIDEAAVVFDLERSSLRIGLERIDECIREANAACGYAAEEIGSSSPMGTVLVVDDEHDLRVLASEILRQEGFTVLDTGDPREALCIAQASSIRLLLTDVVMPVMNGCELAEQVQSFSPQTKVLFMSAYSSSALPPGAHFIAKPFTVERLLSTVSGVLTWRSPFSRRDSDPRPRAGTPGAG